MILNNRLRDYGFFSSVISCLSLVVSVFSCILSSPKFAFASIISGMQKILRPVCIVLLAFVSVVADAGEPRKPATIPRGDYTYTRQYLSWLIDEKLDDDVPGLSIALIDDQTIVWAKGFGLADKERKLAATEKTVYRAGGISTLFTAAAVMQLADRDKVDIDLPVTLYVREFAIQSRFPNAPPITPRNLMTHHAGMPFALLNGMWAESPVDLSTLMRALPSQHLAYPPNTVFAFSNLGYSVLGYLVQQVSGRDFADYTQDALLQPLGMAHSSFRLNDDLRPLLAQGYRHGERKDALATRDVPALGLYTNVTDLGRFVEMLFAGASKNGKTVLTQQSIDRMLQSQNDTVALDLDNSTGLAWMLSDIAYPQAGRVAWHYGTTPLFRSRVLIAPEHKLGVVVMANSSRAYEAVKEVSEYALELMLETKTGQRAPPQHDAPAQNVITPASATLNGIGGDYATAVGLVPLRNAGDHVEADVMGWGFRLLPQQDGWLRVQYRLFGLIPLPIEMLQRLHVKPLNIGGLKTLVLKNEGERYLLGVRLPKAGVSPAWRKRLGRYEVADKDALTKFMEIEEGTLAHEDGNLYFSYRLPSWLPLTLQVPLTPLDDTTAVIAGYGTGLGETVEVVRRGGEERLLFSGYQLRRIEK